VPGLIATGTMTRIIGPEGERLVPLKGFFKGRGKTVLRSREILAEFHVPAPLPRTGGTYMKYSIRGDTDLAIVGIAAKLVLDGKCAVKQAHIVLGAVAPTPFRARNAEKLLIGHLLKDELIEEVALAASEESRPISDQRSTAEYRKEMVRVWMRHAVKKAFRRASGNGCQ